MNYRQKEFQRRKLFQLIEHSNRCGSHSGCTKINVHNTYAHEEAKHRLNYILTKKGYEIFTEVKFTSGGQADLVAIKEGIGTIIEIRVSETKQELTEKVKKYPSEFNIISLNPEEITSDFEF